MYRSPPYISTYQRILQISIAIFAVIAILRFVQKADPLYDIPGPFLARWTSFWVAYQVRRGRKYLVVDALHKVHHTAPHLSTMPYLPFYFPGRNMANLFASLLIMSLLRTRMLLTLYTDKDRQHSTNLCFMMRS